MDRCPLRRPTPTRRPGRCARPTAPAASSCHNPAARPPRRSDGLAPRQSFGQRQPKDGPGLHHGSAELRRQKVEHRAARLGRPTGVHARRYRSCSDGAPRNGLPLHDLPKPWIRSSAAKARHQQAGLLVREEGCWLRPGCPARSGSSSAGQQVARSGSSVKLTAPGSSRPGGECVAGHMLLWVTFGAGGRHGQDCDCRCRGRRAWCWASAVRGWPRGDGPGTRRRGGADWG